MQVELTGKIASILPEQRFNGKNGEIVKNAFVVEYQDNGYTQRLCLDVMGEDKFEKMKSSVVVGNEVLCRFSVASREWNGRWFTSASCFYCANVGSNAQQQNVNNGSARQKTSVQQQQQAQETQKSDDLPF